MPRFCKLLFAQHDAGDLEDRDFQHLKVAHNYEALEAQAHNDSSECHTNDFDFLKIFSISLCETKS